MKIYLGTDHNGFVLKNSLRDYLNKNGYIVVDVSGEKLDQNDDFPIFAQKVVVGILTSDDPMPLGILLCGSGQGMCMASNRFKGIRAVLGYDVESISSSRNDDDANVLCLPARHLKKDTANMLVQTFLNTPFSGAVRFRRRIKEIDQY